MHAGVRTEALLLAQWALTARTIGGKCTGNGTWLLFTREGRFREALYSQEGLYLMQASTGSSKTAVCCTNGSVASNGVMGAVCVFLNNVIAPVTVEPVGRPASQLAKVAALC